MQEEGTHSQCDGVGCSRDEATKSVVLKKFWAVVDEHRLWTITWEEDWVKLQNTIDLSGMRPPGAETSREGG